MNNRLIACVIACVVVLLLIGAVNAKEITVKEKRIESGSRGNPVFIISDCYFGMNQYVLMHDEYAVSGQDYYKISMNDKVEVGDTPRANGIVSVTIK